jgi:hypothetical protein
MLSTIYDVVLANMLTTILHVKGIIHNLVSKKPSCGLLLGLDVGRSGRMSLFSNMQVTACVSNRIELEQVVLPLSPCGGIRGVRNHLHPFIFWPTTKDIWLNQNVRRIFQHWGMLAIVSYEGYVILPVRETKEAKSNIYCWALWTELYICRTLLRPLQDSPGL